MREACLHRWNIFVMQRPFNFSVSARCSTMFKEDVKIILLTELLLYSELVGRRGD